MIKKEIYPKTKRVSLAPKIVITEKLDGSNLTIFRLDDTLYIAQRQTIFGLDEIDELKNLLYQGLYGWLKENGIVLYQSMNDGSALCGEWIGMGKLKYDFGKRFFMFAKANIGVAFELYNINHDHELFKYSFTNEIIPDFIGEVPIVTITTDLSHLAVAQLNVLYDLYCFVKKRSVEGFVINFNGQISKYVRMKNGKLADHFDREETQVSNPQREKI